MSPEGDSVMMNKSTDPNPLLYTVKERCKMCYTCVRECPAKAIRVISGQAEIIPERCICCGNCVNVCSQNAKRVRGSVEAVEALLKSEDKCIAIVAPSFPAEFGEIKDYRIFVSMIRELGFDKVCEVAFGADLVAHKHKELINDLPDDFFVISSSCPAVVNYVEHYHPELVPHIAKIVSPMIAMAKVVKKKYGKNIKVVFIGPCIAKKDEATDPLVEGNVNKVLTFHELREFLRSKNIFSDSVKPTEFDPPLGGRGAIFPVSRGMLQTLKMNEDISSGVVVAEGREDFTEALKEFHEGLVKNYHLDLLCCQGCIMGPGMSKDTKRFARRTGVAEYVKEKLLELDVEQWQKDMETYLQLDLTREYLADDQRVAVPGDDKIWEILKDMGKETEDDLLNCGACGYETCVLHAVAILKGLAENEMCLPYTIDKLHNSIIELEKTRAALKHSEKLASMGQLAAGIAHEVNNPLGVVLLYSNLLLDEIDKNSENYEDIKMVAEQAERCKNIVGGLLNFARKNDVNYTKVNVLEVVNSVLKSIIKPKEVIVEVVERSDFPQAEFDPDQIKQVLTNLIKNSVEALENRDAGKITVTLNGSEKELSITIEDNGPGIENMDKIFVPFYTTKPAGKGTGLGLPVSYGIVKMHRGAITAVSNNDPSKGETGTTFKITLPRKKPETGGGSSGNA
jgi:iron only hydrogenase large subunit-like protein/two-component sensor histidine kinase